MKCDDVKSFCDASGIAYTLIKCDDVKSFCDASGIAYTLIKCGPFYLLSVPAAASSEVIKFLDTNGVQHSRPCSVITNYHDIYLTLDG